MGQLHSEIFVPSHKDGVAILRWLSLGAELRHRGDGWRFENVSRPPPWKSLWLVRPQLLGGAEDYLVEWLLEDGFVRQEDAGTRIGIVERGRKFLRQIDASMRGGIVLSSTQRTALADVVRETREEFPDHDNFGLAQVVAQKVFIGVFGFDWQQEHVNSARPPTAFFRNAQTEDADQTLGGMRVIQLAEMILNLQDVPGLVKSIDLIRAGAVESGFAELEVGKLLHVNHREFRFVVPKGRKGDDYDLEVEFPGLTVCGETKCKIERSQVSESGLLDALDAAREQLPPDRPGIVFAAIPQTWGTSNVEAGQLLKRAADNFLRNTGRVVSVKFHSSLLLNTGTSWQPRTVLLEIDNPKPRFAGGTNWTVFSAMDELPPHWVNLLDECS